MHRLPTRVIDGHWEVQIPVNGHVAWIRCDSQQDARRMSDAGNLAFDAIERKRTGEELAQELEDAAHLFLKYKCTDRAAWLAEHAKVARGEPSIYDSASDDLM